LTARLFDTLHYLVENHARVVTRNELVSAVWGRRQVDDANVAMAVSSLRKTLQGNETTQSLIATLPGKGFQFAASVTFESAPSPPAAAELDATPGAVRRVGAGRYFGWRNLRAAGAVALVIAVAGAALLWRMAPVDTHSAAPPAFVPPPHSIAVLAFRNASGDPAQEYFSDGLSEELINALSQVGALHVSARSSAFSFKRKPASETDIARRLNVGAVLSGSVGRHGGRLSIDAKLTDGVTGALLWAQHYDRAEGETLRTQGELAAAVTSALRVRLTGGDVAALTQGGTTNPKAFDAYLRAMAAIHREKSEADFKQELMLLDEAVTLDPTFAIGQAARAKDLWSIAARTSSNDRNFVRGLKDESLAAAKKAVALAPDLAIAHIALGFALGAYVPDFRRQQAEFSRARDLAPGDVTVLREYGRFEALAGHYSRAIEAGEHAIALDPLKAGSYVQLAWTWYWARKPDEALAALRHAAALGGFPHAFTASLEGMIELMRGDTAAAIRSCQDAPDWELYVCLAVAYHKLGRQNDAEAQLAKLQALGTDSEPFGYAEIYAQWGRPDDALKWLEKSFDLPDQGIIQVPTDPWLDPIRQMPQFKELEQRLDLAP
jgi:serine/threonine-protein kinase